MPKDTINSESSSRCPRIEILPQKTLINEMPKIRLIGFKANETITLRAHMRDDGGKKWASHATFKANSHGVVEVNRQRPLSGSYDEVDPFGLIWSMSLTPDEKEISAFTKTTLDPMTVTFTAEVNGKPLASADLERSHMRSNVKRIPVRENGLVGTFFYPVDSDRQSGVIVLSGSGGGASEHSAALLASHGYAAFALAYFAMEDLPTELADIPLEYLEKGIHWMQAQKAVDSGRLAVMGWSRGGELALLLGATFREIKAVVAFVPSNVIWSGVTRDGTLKPAWTYHGKPLPFVHTKPISSDRIDSEMRMRAAMPIRLTPHFLRAMEDEAAMKKAAILVEKVNGPILLISGQDDQMWPSSLFSQLVIDRLAKHNHPYQFEHLSYRGAGHMIRPDYMPKTFTITRHPVTNSLFELGGNAKDNTFASLDSWSKTVDFLDKNLKK
jgi:dienelactone hydrolase